MKNLKPSARENKRYLLIKGKIKDIEKLFWNLLEFWACLRQDLHLLKQGKTMLLFL